MGFTAFGACWRFVLTVRRYVTVVLASVACAWCSDVLMYVKLGAQVRDTSGAEDKGVSNLSTPTVDLDVCTVLTW